MIVNDDSSIVKIMKKLVKLSKGFTLVELLIVVSIIGILASMIITNVTSSRSKADDAKRKSDLNQLKTAMQLYYGDNQGYPGGAGSSINACGDGDDACPLAGGGVMGNSLSGTVYMKESPEYTTYAVSGEEYDVCVLLENTTDPDVADSQDKCGAGSEGEFCVCND